jgi:hypothetical protein
LSFVGPIRALRRTSDNGAAPSIVKPGNYSGLPDGQIVADDCRRAILRGMASTKPTKSRSGRRGDPVSLYPLTPEQAIKGIFQIKPEDVKRIVAKRPGKKKR